MAMPRGRRASGPEGAPGRDRARHAKDRWPACEARRGTFDTLMRFDMPLLILRCLCFYVLLVPYEFGARKSIPLLTVKMSLCL